MFGIYRTFLALLVLFHHIYGLDPLARYAVFAFFGLSGFLMTLLMCEVYQGRPLDFAINRVLRIYPAYWVSAGAAALIILIKPLPDMMAPGDSLGWGLPTDWTGLAQNAFLVLPTISRRLLPAAWAISNELFFYVLIGLGLTATLKRTLLFLVVSVVAVLWVHDHGYLYFHLAATAFPFAVGSLAYHLQKLPRAHKVIRSPAFFILSFSALMLAGYARDAGIVTMSVFSDCLNMLVLMPLVLVLFIYNPPAWLRRLDDRVGLVSYPIYVVQNLAMLIITDGPPRWLFDWRYQSAALALTIFLAILIVVLIDLPVERLRQSIRERGLRAKAADAAV